MLVEAELERFEFYLWQGEFHTSTLTYRYNANLPVRSNSSTADVGGHILNQIDTIIECYIFY